MAKPHSQNRSSSLQSYLRAPVDFHPNVLASCYSVSASTSALTGFHYSTTPAGGNGVPEVGSGNKPPPISPLLSANYPRPAARNGGRTGEAVQTIAGDCERVFCETLRSTFLSEEKVGSQDSLAVGALDRKTASLHPKGTPATVEDWLEVWDYASDLGPFRGFVTQSEGERTLFVFFEPEVVPKELKPSLMALMELAGSVSFDCSQLVVCLSKSMESNSLQGLMRDLGWVGFELTTLAQWSGGIPTTSEEWLFLSIEV